MAWWENPGTKTYKNLDLTDLEVDQAYLNITNLDNSSFYLYSLSEQCYKVSRIHLFYITLLNFFLFIFLKVMYSQ